MYVVWPSSDAQNAVYYRLETQPSATLSKHPHMVSHNPPYLDPVSRLPMVSETNPLEENPPNSPSKDKKTGRERRQGLTASSIPPWQSGDGEMAIFLQNFYSGRGCRRCAPDRPCVLVGFRRLDLLGRRSQRRSKTSAGRRFPAHREQGREAFGSDGNDTVLLVTEKPGASSGLCLKKAQ